MDLKVTTPVSGSTATAGSLPNGAIFCDPAYSSVYVKTPPTPDCPPENCCANNLGTQQPEQFPNNRTVTRLPDLKVALA